MDIHPSRVSGNLAATLLLLCCLIILAGCGAPADASGGTLAPTPVPSPPTPAPPTAPPASKEAPQDDLAPLSDEFDNAQSLTQWRNLATVNGYPNQIETVDVNTTSPGQLFVAPYTSTWFEDYRGVYLYKEVTGDFDVTTRIQATGKHGPIPDRTFSLAGLMARAPRDITMDTWVPGHENWVFITTGYGDNEPRRAGKQQIETKTTVNSHSVLELVPVTTGWVDLRVVRIGPTFLMLYRPDGGAWILSKRYTRTDLPPTLEVGLNAYTNWEAIDGDAATFNRTLVTKPRFTADLQVHSDYIRFRRPQVADSVRARIAGEGLNNAEWLQAIGP
jgi:hypothetical protein